MTPARLALTAAVLLAALWFGATLLGPGAGGSAGTYASSRDCQACHPAVYEEWAASQHAFAWENPAVRERSNDFANQDCIDCHAPRPVFVTGVGNRVLPRAVRRAEGVDCIACHLLPDGRVAGTVTDDDAACRPVATPALSQPEHCAGCHNQHQTVDQWRASEWPERGEDCLSCHMPPRADGPGRSHAFPGGNDLTFLQRAVTLTGERTPSGWTAVVENVGAGHAFPTDERSRAADLFWRPAGTTEWRHLDRIRDPYRFETHLESTLVHAHQTRRAEIPAEDGVDAVEVALFYKRSPIWEDPERPDPEREAVLVHRIELGP